MDVWSWICELPDSEEWSSGATAVSYEVAARGKDYILLRAERTVFEPDPEASSISFSLHFDSSSGDPPEKETVNLWVSDKCTLSPDQPFMPLILQLLREIITRAPNAHDSSACPRSQLQNIKPDPISWILETHSQESFSTFFNLVFLTRLFWTCVFDAPSEVGSLYFHSLLTPNLGTFSCKHAPVLRAFFVSVGTEVELCFTRTFGYMLAKSVLFCQMGMGPARTPTEARRSNDLLGLTYGMESHGMWILKGYIPVNSMECVLSNRQSINQFQYYPLMIEPKESVLKYALAHQQLEGVIQMEYNVVFSEGFIQVQAKVDNIRLHVVKLGFKNQDGLGDDDDVLRNERHFPSRVRVWVGPEVGASYVGCLSLGRSMDNAEQEVAMEKTMKGSYGKLDVPKVKGMARVATRTTVKNWRWDQDVEGNTVVLDGILYDPTTGAEVATWRPPVGEESQLVVTGFTKRYSGGNRAFTKSGGVVFAGDEFGGDDGGVRWRLSKDMEGSVLKWRIGVEVWLSYWPNEVSSSYCETRKVEWCDEVDLPLIPGKHT